MQIFVHRRQVHQQRRNDSCWDDPPSCLKIGASLIVLGRVGQILGLNCAIAQQLECFKVISYVFCGGSVDPQLAERVGRKPVLVVVGEVVSRGGDAWFGVGWEEIGNGLRLV